MRLLLFAVVGVVLRGLLRARSLPPNRPAKFTGTGPVVCLGASTVQGNISYDWVSELGRRLPERTFVNAGVNGDTSGQVLARVPSVVACRPSASISTIAFVQTCFVRGMPS